MIRFRDFIAATALLAMAGCATAPMPVGEAKAVPADRVRGFQQRPAGEFSTLVFVRDVGMMGGGCYAGVYLNGTLAARIGPGEKMTAYVQPGEIRMRLGRDPEGRGLCGGIGEARWTQRETIARSGETKHFRLSLDESGTPDVQRAED